MEIQSFSFDFSEDLRFHFLFGTSLLLMPFPPISGCKGQTHPKTLFTLQTCESVAEFGLD